MEARAAQAKYNEQMREKQREKDELEEAARLEGEKIAALAAKEGDLNSTDRAKLAEARKQKKQMDEAKAKADAEEAKLLEERRKLVEEAEATRAEQER